MVSPAASSETPNSSAILCNEKMKVKTHFIKWIEKGSELTGKHPDGEDDANVALTTSITDAKVTYQRRDADQL